MSMEHQPTNPFKDYESGSIALGGFFLVGLGAGFFIQPLWLGLTAGAILGLGVGLIAMAWMSRDRYK
jgi:hypothetical protein